MLTADPDVEVLTSATQALEAALASLVTEPKRPPARWAFNAATDLFNAHAPVLHSDPDPTNPRVFRCRATFGAADEGPPGLVHGGVLAFVLDHCFGAASTLAEIPGVTGTLTLRYERPTPLHEELTFVGEVERTEGRKAFLRGAVSANGEVCVRAEAVMITLQR